MNAGGDQPSVKAIGADDADLEPGTAVGEYVVRDKIGEGGFGSVFRAEHPLIGKQVAIKVLARQYSSDPEMVSRFVAEARAVNQIRNRNIIDIFSFGQLEDGRSFYIMEYLAGRPLDEYLAARGTLTLAEALPILRGVARAIDAAHDKGIAHRDLKPENVFLVEEPDQPAFPKLLDFGIAKLLSKEEERSHKTRTGAPIGTPMYMSPEQCRGRGVDHRTDVYAFGIMVYRMLVGRVPFDAESFMDILVMQMNDEPERPSSANPAIPPQLDAGILWMLEKSPDERPASLSAALRAIEDAAESIGMQLPVASGPSGVFDAARSAVVSTGLGAGDTGLANTVPSGVLSEAIGHAAKTGVAEGPKSARWTLVVVAMLLVGAAGGAIWYAATRGQREVAEPAPVAPPRAATPPLDAAVAVDAGATRDVALAQLPKYVTLSIAGPPEGTEVVGPGGQLLGVAPGPVQLERSDVEVVLTFKAAGHLPASVAVVPSEDREIEVSLRAPHPPKPERSPRRNNPKNRNSIEDPF